MRSSSRTPCESLSLRGSTLRGHSPSRLDVEFRYGEPVVDGDRAAVEYWAVITSTSGHDETLAGVSLLRFDEAGRVVEHRDVWASEPGAQSLPRWAPS